MTTPTTAKPYRYFVSYAGQSYAGPVYGWADLNLSLPIRSGDDIQKIATHLEETNRLETATVLSFQRFDAEDGAA